MAKPSLEPDLDPIDKLLDRWASFARADSGQGHISRTPMSKEMDRALGNPLTGCDPVMPDDILEIDQIIARSPMRVRLTIHVWYLSPAPSAVKAKRLGISRSALYIHWSACLRYVQGARESVHSFTAVMACSA